MIKELPISEWVAALRSGEYQQGRGTLTRILDGGTKQHCCLGVACHVAGAQVFGQQKGQTFYNFPLERDGAGHAHGFFIGLTLNDLGKAFTGPEENYGQSKLYTMNDDEGKTFDEIADFIEANYDTTKALRFLVDD